MARAQPADLDNTRRAYSEDGSPLDASLPSHKPSTIYVAAELHHLVKVRVDPQTTEDTITVRLKRGVSTMVRVMSPYGDPIDGVDVRISGTLRGTTDSDGELMVNQTRSFGWTTTELGQDGDGLVPVLPTTRRSRRDDWQLGRFGYVFIVERDDTKGR